MLRIAELLGLRQLDTTSNIKIIRHQDKIYDVDKLRRFGQLERYQSYQGGHKFDGCGFVVSFTGLEHSKALLFGIYKVRGNGKVVSEEEVMRCETCFSAEYLLKPQDLEQSSSDPIYYYELEKQTGYEDLEGRVVIAWGAAAIKWHQWLCWKGRVIDTGNKEVLEILPEGYVIDFPGYLDFVLAYDQLVAIVNDTDATKKWHTLLSAVAGVYLITNTSSGDLYVGSAYGADGILGRWKKYAKHPTGGNPQLEQLFKNDRWHTKDLQFTILQTLPRTLTPTEVIHREWKYKEKLGRFAHALNPEPIADVLHPEPKDDVDTDASFRYSAIPT